MKDIMNKRSSYNIDGVGSFSYIPNKNKKYKDRLTYRYYLSEIKDLEDIILSELEPNIEYLVESLWKKYVISTRFTKSNIKNALINLREKRRAIIVISENTNAHIRKGTMPDSEKIKLNRR